MVLTVDEYSLAQVSTSWRLKSMLKNRRQTTSFTEQCCIDREIQRLVSTTNSPAYKFNCYVIHTAVKFTQMRPMTDAGWDRGPTNPQVHDIWRKSPLYSPIIAEPMLSGNNNMADVSRNSDILLCQLPAASSRAPPPVRDREIGCCSSFFGCIASIFG